MRERKIQGKARQKTRQSEDKANKSRQDKTKARQDTRTSQGKASSDTTRHHNDKTRGKTKPQYQGHDTMTKTKTQDQTMTSQDQDKARTRPRPRQDKSRPRSKCIEESFPSLIQTGESSSIHLILGCYLWFLKPNHLS